MKKLFTLFTFLITSCLFAQNSYQRGYFKDNDGKITECLIYNLAWKNNPTEFQYKYSEADNPETMTIKEVSEFGVDNAYKYHRFTTLIERSSTVTNLLDRGAEPQWNSETLFLNVLVEGKLNLYKYESGNIVKYFYSADDHSKATQLLYKEHYDSGSVRKNFQYRQQLYNLMKDKFDGESRFKKLNYRQADLVKLFKEYNAGEGETTTDYAERKNKGDFNIRFTSGVSLASLEVENRLNNAEFDFGSKASFRAGMEFEYILPFNNNKWSIFADPHFAFYKDAGTNEDNIRYAAEYKSVEIPVGARHHFYVTPQAKLFVDSMLSFDLAVSDSFISYNAAKLEGANTTHFAIGAGVAWNRLSGEVRYNFSRGFLEYVHWQNEYRRLDVIIAFKLI